MRWCLVLIFALAACGGGGDSPPEPGFDFTAFHDRLTQQQVTPYSQIHNSGSHSYQGYIELNLPLGTAAPQPYLGRFDMRIQFNGTGADATGQANGFQGSDGKLLGGNLAFSGGTLIPNANPKRDFVLFADLDGTLTDTATAYDLSARVAADFYGSDAAGFAGRVFAGDIRQGGRVDIFDGTFAGEKQP